MMTSAPIYILTILMASSLFLNKLYPNGYEIEQIKKEIKEAQEKIKIIKILKKDMDEKEWKLKKQ